MEENINNKKEKLSFRDFLITLKWLVNFSFKLSSFGAVSEIIIRIFLDLSPLFNAYIIAHLLDKIITVIGSNSNLNEIFPLLGILLFYNLAMSVFNYAYGYFGEVMNTAASFKAPQFLYEHISLLGIQTLESPDVANKI
jgi:ABC-type multidrug transport system fused ATPase/permease subunit